MEGTNESCVVHLDLSVPGDVRLSDNDHRIGASVADFAHSGPKPSVSIGDH